MQKEILHIKNFGPITDVKLELGKFTVLIGEQATGKSTIAKLLAVCRYFSYIISEGVVGGNKNEPSEDFLMGLNAWGLKDGIKKDSYIHYRCEHYEFEAKGWFSTIGLPNDSNRFAYSGFTTELTPISKAFTNLLDELKKVVRDDSGIHILKEPVSNRLPSIFYKIDVASVLDNPFYLPAERGLQSIFSIGKTGIANLSDSLFNQLAEIDGILRQFTTDTFIEPLGIYYKNERGAGLVRKGINDEYYKLSESATGYQTAIPIVLTIEFYNRIRKKKKPFFIEEPELSLFPAAQNKLVEFLVSEGVGNGHSILLNTHSPYILTSLNNLMYAYQVGQADGEKVADIIKRKYWISPTDVRAYMLKPDGTCENILDEGEMKVIDAGKIDEISRSINADFDKMLQIEFGKE